MPWDTEFGVYPSSVIDINGFTDPVTEWFAIESPSAVVRRPIKSAWHNYKMLAQSDNSPLPSGWERLDSGPELKKKLESNYGSHSFPRDVPGSCFRHCSDSDDIFYWYPVPALVPTWKDNIESLPQTAYLFAQTSRAFLYGGKKIEASDLPLTRNEAPSIRIINSSDLHVGYLRLNNDEDVQFFQKAERLASPRKVELVATCKGYTGTIFDVELAEAKAKERGVEKWERQLKDCYFVLWIEWMGNVAYRRGCGAVVADIWEEMREKELVDLVLG